MTNKKGYFFYPDISYRKKSRMIYKKGYSASIPISDSGGIQTHDLQNRNLTLYSAKLRSQTMYLVSAKVILFCGITKFITNFVASNHKMSNVI